MKEGAVLGWLDGLGTLLAKATAATGRANANADANVDESADASASADIDADTASDAPALLQRVVEQGLDHLPMPGSGRTLDRWRAFAAVARHDLSLAKLYEGHTDALAILQELGAGHLVPVGSTWGVWAAEAPAGRAVIEAGARRQSDGWQSEKRPSEKWPSEKWPGEGRAKDGTVTLNGGKCWCSGAATVSHALMTAWHADGRGPQLVCLPLRQRGVQVSTASWHAVGMAASASLDVRFDGAEAVCVGEVGAYLARPGFWQGGAGIAACWYGGALGIAAALHAALVATPVESRSPLRLAALGRVDLMLAGTASLLHDAAAWIDAHPTTDAAATSLRVRLAAERCATAVLDEVGRALGATPFCRDIRFARAAADLPVFIRQSHADRDFAALGERVATTDDGAWKL